MFSEEHHVIVQGEDDIADARVIERLLQRAGFKGKYENYSKGNDIVDRVLRNGAFAGQDLPLPDLILLDIGLPVLNGIEVLEKIRKSADARSIPVLIFSGSNSKRDLDNCVFHGANGYIQKTANIKGMADICEGLIGSWLRMAAQAYY